MQKVDILYVVFYLCHRCLGFQYILQEYLQSGFLADQHQTINYAIKQPFRTATRKVGVICVMTSLNKGIDSKEFKKNKKAYPIKG